MISGKSRCIRKMINKVVIVSRIFMLFLINLSESSPLSYTKCSLSDSSCLTTQAAEALPAFVQGIPELGIKRLDEINVESTKVHLDGLEYEMNNIIITGLNDATVDKLSVNMYLKIMRLTFHTTFKVFIGNFKTDGFLFSVPINGEGSGNITMKNVYADLLLPFEVMKNKDGKDVINLKDYRYGLQITDRISYELTFQGNELRETSFNEFMNDVWRITSKAHLVFFYDAISSNIYQAIKTFLDSQPLEDLAINK